MQNSSHLINAVTGHLPCRLVRPFLDFGNSRESVPFSPQPTISPLVDPSCAPKLRPTITRVFWFVSITVQRLAMGSIPIARSINLVDSVALPLLKPENGANCAGFWTQVGPKFFKFTCGL